MEIRQLDPACLCRAEIHGPLPDKGLLRHLRRGGRLPSPLRPARSAEGEVL